jgi:hypothetical protein
MPEDKSDMRIVAKPVDPGSPPVGLRLAKTVRGRDESLYMFMLPGVVPNPLKLSIHPTGEIHLAAKGAGIITRLDADKLIESLKSGSLDSTLSNLLTPNLPREPAEGFVVPPELMPEPGVKEGEPLKDVDLSVERLLEGMTKIDLDDLSRLPEAITWLRQQGRLPLKATILFASKSSDRPTVFVSLLDGPAVTLPEKVPDGLPFPKTLQALLDGLRNYGGLLLTMPDEAKLRNMAKVVGLGDLFEGLDRLSTSLDEPAVEAKLMERWKEIQPGIGGPARALSRAKPLRPLSSKGRSKGPANRGQRSSRRRSRPAS